MKKLILGQNQKIIASADGKNYRRAYEQKEVQMDYELIQKNLVIPAYELCIKASHCFNLLDSRGVISVNERQAYILRIRSLVQKCCKKMVQNYE